MSIAARIRRSETPLYKTLKSSIRRLLAAHIPVRGPLRHMFAALYKLHVAAREMTGLAVRFFWYEPLFRSQCEHVGERFYMEQLPYLVGVGRMRFGAAVRLSGKSSIIFSNRMHARPELIVGDGSFVGHGCAFIISQSVRIGGHCLIASGVRIIDSDGHPTDAVRRRRGDPSPPEQVQPVNIGDDVWIGSSATLLKGVNIGSRSIVAACSVVAKDVPPDTIVAGNPARVIRRLCATHQPEDPNPTRIRLEGSENAALSWLHRE